MNRNKGFGPRLFEHWETIAFGVIYTLFVIAAIALVLVSQFQ